MFILHGRTATAGHERKDASWSSDEVRCDPLRSHRGPVQIAGPPSNRERFRMIRPEPETEAPKAKRRRKEK